VHAGELVVCGNFTSAGGIGANRIAKWNGSAWSALGLGLNSDAYALTVIGSDLYVGGSFTAVGGVGVNRVARWNGSWSALGTGTNNAVYSLANNNGQLLLGGSFTSAGGISANRIARWNGTNWSALSSGMTGGDPIQVLAIALYGGMPYAGGDFSNAGGIIVNNIARWMSQTGIKTVTNQVPGSYKLYQNYPNPFNPSTKIKFDIMKSSHAKLRVYDGLGKELALLVNETLKPGTYEVDYSAAGVSSGIYYYELITGTFRETKKMILAK
jgi:hypothetical protein